MSYRFADSCQTYTTAVCTAKETLDDGQGNCPKHVEFYSKNKFEKLVHLVGFYYNNLRFIILTCTCIMSCYCSRFCFVYMALGKYCLRL